MRIQPQATYLGIFIILNLWYSILVLSGRTFKVRLEVTLNLHRINTLVAHAEPHALERINGPAPRHRQFLADLERKAENNLSIINALIELARWLDRNGVPPIMRVVPEISPNEPQKLWIIADRNPFANKWPEECYLVSSTGQLCFTEVLGHPHDTTQIRVCGEKDIAIKDDMERIILDSFVSYCLSYGLKWDDENSEA